MFEVETHVLYILTQIDHVNERKYSSLQMILIQ